MIKKASEIINTDKKIRLLIAGYPGIGKTTLALSAPKPLLIDVDRGTDRVEARYRTDFIQPNTYEELLEDLVPFNLNDYETLVIDTGGQLIKLMSAYVIKQNAKNGQRDGSLSLKGYGAVGREFARFVDYCYYQLNKHVVIVFHAKEEKDGDNTRLRILVEGQTKDNVWQPMDLGGFMEMQNKVRTIGFGVLTIPELNGNQNEFLTNLFHQINENIKAEAKDAEKEKKAYQKIINTIKEATEAITTPSEAMEVLDLINNQKHILTSEKESKSILFDKTKELGFKWNKLKGEFTDEVSDDTKSA